MKYKLTSTNYLLVLVSCLLIFAACTRAEPPFQGKPIDAANEAYFQFELKTALSLFLEVLNNEHADTQDRTKAGRRFARATFLVHQDIARAREILSVAHSLGDEKTLTSLVLSWIEREAGNYELARAAAMQAANEAETEIERQNADTAYATAVLDEAANQILFGSKSDLNHDELNKAHILIGGVLDAQRGSADPSATALAIAIIVGDGQKALEAWQSYFHVHEGTELNSVLAKPGRILESAFSIWDNSNATADENTELFLALADSRMYRPAALLAMTAINFESEANAEILEILAYEGFLTDLLAETHAYYRRTAQDLADKSNYQKTINGLAETLWSKMFWSNDMPPFSRDGFAVEISSRFGADMEFKHVNGFFGLHYGHRVADESFSVDQYGESALIRFVSLDLMISNGYNSWFWDGRAQVGGWADKGLIVQVRSSYSDGGIEAWKTVSDPKTRRDVEKKIEAYSASDIAAAREDPFAYLPGLARKIELSSYDRIVDGLRKQGLSGPKLRLAFIGEIERIELESSIIAHEGRHAIDAQSFANKMRNGTKKEYRAKLSEVAFSSMPWLAIGGGILLPNIGDGSAHGDANLRIMKGIVNWINAHRSDIEKLDNDLPLLPQLDKLSDEQLRSVFRSMDPMHSQ